ncbi:PRC-barrel domain containing protein [Caldicellulosiruptor morganii]|uniref:PRC-barrel domain containing protein n=1 Tax=Caldicellulosiruptor morganii TaxID=1387555 RepID=A0ABY7BSU3_9FIRM|nr:PRC-barrel domain containing protein [Caldicellulosiruptor morganii]WAM34881.1 PRC-barrel domain containing protein [Caldicellulosiruptor morganii]
MSNIKNSKPIICQNSGKIIGSSDTVELLIDDNGNICSIEIKKRRNFRWDTEVINWEDIVIIGDDVIIVNMKEGEQE